MQQTESARCTDIMAALWEDQAQYAESLCKRQRIHTAARRRHVCPHRKEVHPLSSRLHHSPFPENTAAGRNTRSGKNIKAAELSRYEAAPFLWLPPSNKRGLRKNRPSNTSCVKRRRPQNLYSKRTNPVDRFALWCMIKTELPGV